MKVFMGLFNIASVLGELSKGFNEIGIETYSVVYGTSSYLIDKNTDFEIYPTIEEKLKFFDKIPITFLRKGIKFVLRKLMFKFYLKSIWNKAVKECDTFIFLWSSFDKQFNDFEKLKKLGKKVIVVFVGDDVRWYPAMEQEFKKYGLDPIEYDDKFFHGLGSRLNFMRKAEKYADFIFSRLDQAQLQLRPYYRWNMIVFPEKYKERNIQSVRPLVIHAPSNSSVKGTKYVVKAVDELKASGLDFEFKLIQNLPHLEAVKLYEQSDIVIDQLLCPGTGKLATEALACGKVVMGIMAYDTYPQKNPADCPVVDVNKYTIKNKLQELICDHAQRSQLALLSRKYVERELDVRKFCNTVKSLILGEKIEYDYYPTFFNEYFIPESEEALVEFNQWNKFVMHCDWYKKHVRKESNRQGLHF
jgi:hypothetical protein